MSDRISITLVGATGLTGSHAVDALLASRQTAFDITTITRRPLLRSAPPINAGTIIHPVIVQDLFKAPSEQVGTKGGIYVSCLGTTRKTAGGFDNQVKLDLDLNIELAKKAKADGASSMELLGNGGRDSKKLTRKMILVSSHGASASSSFGYPRIKGQLEDAVRDMGFERCVVLRPGLLIGEREDSRPGETFGKYLFSALGMVGITPSKAQGSEVGKCIAHLAAKLPSEKFVIYDNSKVLALAKAWDAENGTSSSSKS